MSPSSLWGALMANWRLSFRDFCFFAAEFALATAFIIAFAAAVKYGL
jgi:hypothetical protein